MTTVTIWSIDSYGSRIRRVTKWRYGLHPIGIRPPLIFASWYETAAISICRGRRRLLAFVTGATATGCKSCLTVASRTLGNRLNRLIHLTSRLKC